MTAPAISNAEVRKPLSERLMLIGLRVDVEALAYIAILLVAVLSRFYDLGVRVMSHDESLHTYYSWQLEQNGSFQHSPLMHGPLQFHLIALSYFLFGVNDATARVPAAIASILAVAMLIGFRRWLGRWGALVAAALMTISPFMLFYGRYVRNEALVVVIGLMTFYAVFRYFEDRRPKWLYLLAAALALHFTAKETAFIYTAQLMIFLAAMLAWRLLQVNWHRPGWRTAFMIGMLLILIGVMIAGGGMYADRHMAASVQNQTVQPADPNAPAPAMSLGLHPAVTAGLVVAILGALLAGAATIREFGVRLRTEFPALDVLVIATTVSLPQLAAFPVSMLGYDPTAYQDPTTRMVTAIILVALFLIAAAIGLSWGWRRWLIAMGVFFGIFAFFFTTVLTYPFGMFTGLVGALGYWLEQQGVNRGSQPLYYYLLIQVPVYEYLPAIGALLAGALGLGRWLRRPNQAPQADALDADLEGPPAEHAEPPTDRGVFPVVPFLGYWALTATLAYTVAGERMPWLTVHLALPYILLAGWSIGEVLRKVDWAAVFERRGWLMVLLAAFGILGLAQTVGALLGPMPPFSGAELDQLSATSQFLISAAVAVASVVGLVLIARDWTLAAVGRLAGVVVLALLFVLTARTAYRAAYINYDHATEYMVYAHSATGVKTVVNQARELSLRTQDGMGIDIAYDDAVSWPFSWYMREFPNNHFYADNPGRDLLDDPLVIAGQKNWGKVEPILGDRYTSFEYIRMWWPNQSYFDLTWDRIWGALRSPAYRSALWDIWFNRDYKAYGELTGVDMSLENWSPSDRMKLYIRKDMAALIWDYGVAPQSLQPVDVVDPYADGTIQLAAERTVSGEVNFQVPRGVAAGADGTLYVADAGNNRIVKLNPQGELLATWGTLGTEGSPGAPQFTEPWGVAVAPDGSVYVADTWNHRIQHLSADGEVLATFGSNGQSLDLTQFWGPRDVAVDDQGRVFVVDTGNKRVVVFNADEQPLASFGGGGVGPGELDEPVGIAIGPQGRVYIADTWNRRVQVFEETSQNVFEAVAQWPVDAWFGQSLDNKPYLAVSESGQVCLSDPEGYRVICFTSDGTFLTAWGDHGVAENEFGLPIGVAFAGNHLWVVDSGNNRLMEFAPPLP